LMSCDISRCAIVMHLPAPIALCIMFCMQTLSVKFLLRRGLIAELDTAG